MAKGRAIGRFEATLGLVGVVALIVTYSIITGWNPLPSWANWLKDQTVRTLATPAPTWVIRAGDEPTSAAVFDRVIVVSSEGSVEGRDALTGVKLWSYQAGWSGAAGNTQPVVAVGRPLGSGFDVYDAVSGATLWHRDDKEAVWPYQNMVLTLRCPQEFSCVLSALKPADGNTIWRQPINGAGKSLRGLRPAFASLAPISDTYTDSLTAMSQPAPALIGLSFDDDVHAVDTSNGHDLGTFRRTSTTRMVVADKEIIEATVSARGDTCYSTILARNPRTGSVIWRQPGYNARTAGGLGCEQHEDPVGAGSALLTSDPVGRDAVLSVRTGSVLFRAPVGDRVVATNGDIAVTRTADKKSLYAIDLSSGHRLWTRAADLHAEVGIAPHGVILADPVNEKLVVLSPSTGAELLDVKSGATILGVGTHQVIVSIGRSLGPLSVSAG
jgi:outer membrane protein assembly factor BamB